MDPSRSRTPAPSSVEPGGGGGGRPPRHRTGSELRQSGQPRVLSVHGGPAPSPGAPGVSTWVQLRLLSLHAGLKLVSLSATQSVLR